MLNYQRVEKSNQSTCLFCESIDVSAPVGALSCPNNGSLLLVIIILQVVQSFPAHENQIHFFEISNRYHHELHRHILKSIYHLMDISHFSQFSDTTPGSL